MCPHWAYFGNKKEFKNVKFTRAESLCEVPEHGTCLTGIKHGLLTFLKLLGEAH